MLLVPGLEIPAVEVAAMPADLGQGAEKASPVERLFPGRRRRTVRTYQVQSPMPAVVVPWWPSRRQEVAEAEAALFPAPFPAIWRAVPYVVMAHWIVDPVRCLLPPAAHCRAWNRAIQECRRPGIPSCMSSPCRSYDRVWAVWA